MSSVAARIGVALMVIALACEVLPAHAQFGALERATSRFTGGLIWGSLSFRDARRPELLDVSHRHPALRGGFAALYGPFGGQPDTVATLDSIRTTVEWIEGPASVPGAQRTRWPARSDSSSGIERRRIRNSATDPQATARIRKSRAKDAQSTVCQCASANAQKTRAEAPHPTAIEIRHRGTRFRRSDRIPWRLFVQDIFYLSC